MDVSTTKTFENMDNEDKKKVSYFINLLLNQSKYRNLQEEVLLRREEIKKGETLKHEQFWDQLNV